MIESDKSNIIIKRVLVSDIFKTYTYFYIDKRTRHGFLIDPGAEPQRLMAIIKENNWTIDKILLTHGHFDHTGAVESIHETMGIPYFIHSKGDLYLKSTHYNLSRYYKRNIILPNSQYFNDGHVFSISTAPDLQLKVIHTPGHTPDSVLFYDKDNGIAFVGDTIFKDSLGTAKFFGGNEQELVSSIMNKVFTLPSEVILYSGHSEETSVGVERNKYI